MKASGSVGLQVKIERWPLAVPFRITGFVWESVEVVFVSLEQDGLIGRGEAAGVHYKNDHPTHIAQQIESLRPTLEAGRLTRDSLQHLLPPGGARNALDCALWDLEAKLTGRAAWQTAELGQMRPLLTTLTCGADDPEKMAAAARNFHGAQAIKIKLTGDANDAQRVRAVREARKDVWLGVDANQGLTRATLDRLMPTLTEASVALIEQPFPVGQEALLDWVHSPIPIAADESVQGLADIPRLEGRFDVINIKLDKCGGLTEGLAMARAAQSCGIDTMVGNMLGTSLAMAPAFVLGQLCKVVDLDGPALLKTDREVTVQYINGRINCPEHLWGYPHAIA